MMKKFSKKLWSYKINVIPTYEYLFDVNDLDSKKEMLNEIDRNINITIKNLSESFGNRDFKSANKNNIKFSYLEKMKKNLKSLL